MEKKVLKRQPIETARTHFPDRKCTTHREHLIGKVDGDAMEIMSATQAIRHSPRRAVTTVVTRMPSLTIAG
jgi:hypothetical protein